MGKTKWIILAIDKSILNKLINPYMLEKYGINIANHLLYDGFVPINNHNIINPESVIYYDLPYIDDVLFDLIQKFKEGFTFTTECFAWVKSPTYEEMQTLIPDNFPRAKGRTFSEALIKYEGKAKQFEGNDIYPCFFYDKKDENGEYTLSTTNSNQDDFWAFYQYFGADRIVLNHKIN